MTKTAVGNAMACLVVLLGMCTSSVAGRDLKLTVYRPLCPPFASPTEFSKSEDGQALRNAGVSASALACGLRGPRPSIYAGSAVSRIARSMANASAKTIEEFSKSCEGEVISNYPFGCGRGTGDDAVKAAAPVIAKVWAGAAASTASECGCRVQRPAVVEALQKSIITTAISSQPQLCLLADRESSGNIRINDYNDYISALTADFERIVVEAYMRGNGCGPLKHVEIDLIPEGRAPDECITSDCFVRGPEPF